MVARTRIYVLGRLVATNGDAELPLGGRRQRAVLARLVVGFPESVSVDQLVEAVWGSQPPRHVTPTLQAYVSRLRSLLAPAFHISTSAGGYRLEGEGADLDSAAFLEAVQHGAVASLAHRPGEALAVLAPALRLWRDERPLDPFSEEFWATPFAQKLVAARAQGIELLAAAHLECQDPQAAVDVAEPWVTAHPLLESAAVLLMVALYRCGRQSDALEVFRRTRQQLDDDLGLEPSADLGATFAMILNQDPRLDWKVDRSQLPRLLPPRPSMVVGREEDLRHVQQQLDDHGTCTIHGLPGVGKTVLAAELAHRHEGLVAWVPAEDASGLAALTDLASRLGVSPSLGEAELLRQLWARLEERPGWLLVLDNAERAEVVRSWIPPVRNGQVLVTSRNPAWSWLGPAVRLGPLDTAASVEFIRRRAGRATGDRVPLARALDGIALALEQACCYIDETGMSIDRYVGLFARRRGDLMTRGAPAEHPHPVTTTWQMVIDDVRTRSPVAIDVLEMSSFLSGDDVPPAVWEALSDRADELELEDALAELVRYSIIDRSGASIRMHRLVQELIRTSLGVQRRRDCVVSVIAVLRSLVPAGDSGLDAQRTGWTVLTPHLLALLRAADPGDAPEADLMSLVTACFRHLRLRQVDEGAHELLATAFRLLDERAPGRRSTAHAELLASRADLRDAEGELSQARADMAEARRLLARIPEVPALVEARVRSVDGHLLNCEDHPAEAIVAYEQALPALEAHGQVTEVVGARIGLGYSRWSAQDFVGAAEEFRRALQVMAGSSWARHPLHVEAISGLGMMLHEVGDLTVAVELQREALVESIELYGDVDHPSTAYIHDKLGWELSLVGDHPASLLHHQRAVEMLEGLYGPDDPRLAMVVSNRGLAELALGQSAAASFSQQTAFEVLSAAYGQAHRNTKLVSLRLQALRPASGSMTTV